MFTAFFIDSGALYGEIDESVRHYDGTTGGPKRSGRCVVRGAETARGCHPFARISADMDFWLEKKVTFQDQLRAFVPITDQKLLVVRIINNEVQIVLPHTSHLRVEFADTEPQCLVSVLVDLLGRTSFSRPIELVLNHGDLPMLRKRGGALPRYNLDDFEARMRGPLFSLCVSDDFWDLLFPNICRPKLHALPHTTPWEGKKKQAFWRGTDRGAVNWAHSVEEMLQGSTRARFLRTLEPGLADTAFIADDLMNCTVVSSDPNLVPLAGQDAWRFLLDIPGNGYSGSLKQKLTSNSAVLLLTDSGRGSPVFEHYHLGLQEYVHIVPLLMENGNEQIRWALDNDDKMGVIARNANEFMDNYDRNTRCYLWRLLSSFSEALAYDLTDEHGFPDSSVFLRQKVLHRPTPREASEFNRECLELIRSY
eukprot:GEMP01025058.1.p1 GENE.GEMP01025058.1~~GEMP01025058.1.p1  ORF type:complete len:422 (+),score=87.63 GEMP01025058.1:1118-2383(+)